MIKWNCCKIHGLTCLYWTIYIIDCTTIYQMRHHCIMVKSSICWAWDCWAFHNWPTTSMKYKTNCMSWNSMLVTTFAWNSCFFWIQVSEKFPEFHYFVLWFFIHFINQNSNQNRISIGIEFNAYFQKIRLWFFSVFCSFKIIIIWIFSFLFWIILMAYQLFEILKLIKIQSLTYFLAFICLFLGFSCNRWGASVLFLCWMHPAEVRGITNRKTVLEGYENVQAALLDYTLTCYPSVEVSVDHYFIEYFQCKTELRWKILSRDLVVIVKALFCFLFLQK